MFFEKLYTGQKIGGEGAPISFAAFEKEGHFCGHSERIVILSFANKGHKKGDTHFLRGTIRGIYTPYFGAHHSEKMVIIISERWNGICYKSLMRTFFSQLSNVQLLSYERVIF